jgi:ATP-dependent DNA helicase RecQ
VATGQDWFYDEERHRRIATARKAEQQAMLDYIDTRECRLVFLRNQLDDAGAEKCGRCDNCAGAAWSTDVDGAASAAAAERIQRPGVEVAPRKQWPSGMKELDVPASGKIPAGELAEPGRVIGRLSDIGWGPRLRELLDPAPAPDDELGPDIDPETGEPVSATDLPVPKDVLDAVVRVLAGWGWEERPVGVVGIGSRTRPHQLDHLARRISEIGRLPLLGTLVPAGARPGAHANSAQRLAAVWNAFDEPAFPVPAGPVLLVDDLIDTGWTMTVAARLLRRAGASAVLPFALGQAG